MPSPFDSYWEVVEPIWDQLSIDDSDSFTTTSTRVPRVALLLYAAHFCLSEVWNGGLLQFFFNSTGVIAPEAVECFRAIGMPELSQKVAKAAAWLGEEYPRERSGRWDAMLVHSGLSQQQLTEIFDRAKNQYLAFKQATEVFKWDHLTDEIYELAEKENGGFQIAATDFANRSARSNIE